MAGQPVKMARRIEELERMACDLADALMDLTPAQYRADGCGGRIGEAWREANKYAMGAWATLGDLRGLLEPKAARPTASDKAE